MDSNRDRIDGVILQAGNESVPNVMVSDSTLRVQIDSPYSWMYILFGEYDYGNVHIDTEYTNSAKSPASIGLVCHYDQEEGWFEYNVSTNGAYNLLLGNWLSPGIAQYLPLLNGSSKEIQQSGAVQNIGLTCDESNVYLFINGQIIRSQNVADHGLTRGKIGVTASSYENTPVIAVYYWLTVSEP